MSIKKENYAQRILLLKNRALGDAILTIAAGNFLRYHFPDAQLIFATPAWTSPVFKQLKHPWDQVIGINLTSYRGQEDFFNYLLNNRFDLIYEFSQRASSARLLSLYAKSRGLPYLFHNHHHYPERCSIIQRDIRGLARSLDLPLLRGENWIPVLQQRSSVKRVVFGVVATRETKMWPLENFISLSLLLKAQGVEKIIAPLGPQDRILELRLKELDREGLIEIIKLPLDQLAKELSNTDLYIGNDTGLKHLCVFLGIKTISFFGPEEPLEWHPYHQHDHPYLFLKELDCRYQKSHYCDLASCESMACMQFSVDEVLKYIK